MSVHVPLYMKIAFDFASKMFATKEKPRNLRVEEKIAQEMSNIYKEILPWSGTPPFFAILDSCRPSAMRRVYQSPFARTRVGNLEQTHLTSSINSTVWVCKMVQLRLGMREFIDQPAYNLLGTVDEIRIRLRSFSTEGELCDMENQDFKRYFVVYYEILRTAPAGTFSLPPHADLFGDLFAKKKKDMLKFIVDFLEECHAEMGVPLANHGKVGYKCTVNCYLSSLPSLHLLDKESRTTFEFPPPNFQVLPNAKDFMLSKIYSTDWFLLKGQKNSFNTQLIKCRMYPFGIDLHGNVLSEEMGMRFIVAQFTRPNFSCCPFCGEKESEHRLADKDSQEEHCLPNDFLASQPLIFGIAQALSSHIERCKLQAEGERHYLDKSETPTKICHCCGLNFKHIKPWISHCGQRACVVEAISELNLSESQEFQQKEFSAIVEQSDTVQSPNDADGELVTRKSKRQRNV